MEEKKYHYDAFISYRHKELDKFVAENLHRQLEAFRMPGSVAKKRKGYKNQIERVFRDKEELPLTSDLNDPIMNALENSDWLIVICSPRLRESVWCKKEIETFVKLHGREHVLAVLIEGEPEESFPEELLFRKETITNPDGSVEEIKIPIEPLAADVRGKDKKEVLKLMKVEILRILAAMFHMNFDELRQRHKEQKQKQKMMILTLVAMVCLLFAVICAVFAIQMHNKNEMIQGLSDNIFEQHEELKYRQALSLADESRNYMEKDERAKAVDTAVTALTQYDIYSMPYTALAHGALIESLRCYDLGIYYKAQYQLETVSEVQTMKLAPGKEILAAEDNINRLTVWDVGANEILATLSLWQYAYGERAYTFLDDDRIAYYATEHTIAIYSLSQGKVIKEINNGYASAVLSDPNGQYIILNCANGYEVYDATTYECLHTINNQQGTAEPYTFFAEDDSVMAFVGRETTGGEDTYLLQFTNLKSGEIVYTESLAFESSLKVEMKNGIAYIAYNQLNQSQDCFDTYIKAVALDTQQELWQKMIEGYYYCQMEVSQAEGSKLMITMSNGVKIVNTADGSILMEEEFNGTPIACSIYEQEDVYTVFTQKGSYYIINGSDLKMTDYSDCFDLNIELVEFCAETSYGFVLVPLASNRVILYDAKAGTDMKPVEWQETDTSGNYYFGHEEKAMTLMTEYEVPDTDLVQGIFTDAEERYMFVCYCNKQVAVYNLSTYEQLHTFEAGELPITFMGTDVQGYYYIGGVSGGYMLAPDMQYCCWIPGLKGLGKQKDTLYIADDLGQCYEAPIYSLEELIQMADEYR